MNTFTTCKTDNQWEFAARLRQFKAVIRDNLQKWDGIGDVRGGPRGRGRVYTDG